METGTLANYQNFKTKYVTIGQDVPVGPAIEENSSAKEVSVREGRELCLPLANDVR